jgi:sugar/nucleoside kinase (ribokinase family)
MYDLITVGNVTIDLFFRGRDLTQEGGRFALAIGGKYVADYFSEEVGGSAANIAIGCTNLGLNVAPLAKIGENSFKQIILQKFLRKNVSTEFLLSDRNFINISCILLSEKGDRTVVQYPTPHTDLGISEIMMKNLLKTPALYMGNLSDLSLEERARIIDQFKKQGSTVFLNIGTKDCVRPVEEILPYIGLADVLIINRFEFAELIKQKAEKIDLNENQLHMLKHKDGILIITDGKNGSFGYKGDEVFYQEALEPSMVVDTTGAGDGYSAGFITSYLETKDVKTAMKSGSEYAKKIIEKVGAN